MRLLSKAWSSCASTFLFANLSVSPNEEDLEVFEAITQHPLLSKCVRHLWYSGSEFLLSFSKCRYLKELWCQWIVRLYTTHPDRTWSDMLHNSDTETSSWVRHVVHDKLGRAEVTAKYRDAKFVNEGYQKYHEHAIYQQKCLQDGKFFKRLVQGLQKLDFLIAVTLECRWDSMDKPFEPRKGSHLARNWNIFHCSPQRWDWGPSTSQSYLGNVWDGAEHYRILISALAQAQRHVRAFQTGPDMWSAVPPYVFDRSRKTRSAQPIKFYYDNVTALSGVEELILRFATYGSAKTCELFKNISAFPTILGSMNRLKGLELRLPNGMYNDPPVYYTYDQVFPKNMRWDNMKLLRLFQISFGATEFILLFLDGMPELEYLAIGEIVLSQGSWEGIFEALKQMHRLCGFQITDDALLYHHGGRELWRDYLHRFGRLYYDVNTYVVSGGRHPCLESGQPDSAASEYTRGLEPELRQRLIDLDSSRSEVEDAA